ncbi:NAD(P)H-dependent flavin oxidoreductase [Shimia biformata]|uniref:NAD(P)H-dependent flavin oxidoreductase n=1 Tax=Shimia biformata TaxID=1294299 RepID=UPI001EF183B0|nr:nitronate monooxygenase [Shimia biformata]
MFLVSGPELVTSVCRAGMVAAFPSLNAVNSDELSGWLGDIAAGLAGADDAAAVAVNLVTHPSNHRFEDDLAVCIKHKVPLIITALGSPEPVVAPVHAYGGLVFADVNTPALALKAAQRGADGLVLVCTGAGGHTGAVSPFAFVSEVRQFFDGPIVVAGGIGSGAGIRAVRSMGADLAYLGTRFLAAHESRAVDDYKNMVVDSGFSDILCTAAITGAPANKLRPSFVRVGIDPDALPTKGKFDLSNLDTGEVKRWRDLWSAGHGVGAVPERESAEDIVTALKTGFAA